MGTSTSTSLTLRALLKTSGDRLVLGVPGRPVSGLTGAAKALFAAAAAARETVVVVAPTDADAEQLTADARFFLSALEGLSDPEAVQVVLPFPSHEVDPYRGLSPHFDIASARARALFALTQRRARIVVASGPALLPRISPPARLGAVGLTVRPNDDISPLDLGDRLAEAGYTRQDPTDEAGEFSVRGGVVDFYPPAPGEPIRLEFVGDTIESLRTYDPATQRSTGGIDQAHIVPLQELLSATSDADRDDPAAPDRSATIVDYLSPMRPVVLVSGPDEVRAAVVKLRTRLAKSAAAAVHNPTRALPPLALAVD